MKNIFLAFLLVFSFSTFSQRESNVRVDGVLYVPKTQAQRLSIVNLRVGMTCFQSDGVSGLYTYTASGWVYSGGGSTSDIVTTGDGRYTQKDNNLSDLASTSTARTNLGLGTLATQNGTFSGTSSGINSGDNATNSQYSGLATSKENTITSGTTGQYFRGDKTFVALDKTAVGLPNVDNTSDLLKPVSTAQKALFDLKLHNTTSISDLQAFTDASVANFDGSTWERKAGNVASNGGSFAGTIITVNSNFYWERKFDNYVNVKWFGATGLGIVDESTAFNNAISYAGRYQFDNGSGTVFVPKGKYLLNIVTNYSKVSIIGEDENGTILTPFNNENPIILITRDGGWDRMTFSRISFIGNNLSSKGVQFGNSTYTTNDEYAGRVNFDACRFVTFDKCISRMAGNIGIFINNCTFAYSNYHLWGRPNENMQVGVTHVENSHFDNAQLASVYINSGTIGDGQFIFSSCIFEVNPGFVLFVDTYKETEFVPEITFENCWNELNATGGNVMINSISYTPQFAYLKNVSNISFINSPVSKLTLINSNCFLDRSDITELNVTKDNQSLLQIDNAIMESAHTHEFVRTIKSSIRLAGGVSSYFSSYHRNVINNTYNSKIKISIPFNSTYLFLGSSSRNTMSIVGDGTTYNNSESLIINQGDSFLTNINTNIVSGKYYVYTFSYKLTSGLAPNFQLTENITLTPTISLKSTDWQTVCGIVSTFGLSGLPATSRIYLTPASNGSSTIALGGFQLLEFNNQQDAMNFLESKTFAN